MELLGDRTATRAATMAFSPHLKLLASATSARADGDCGGGGSRVEIIRLWRGKGEPHKGRRLEVISTIPCCDGAIRRLAWSACGPNATYPVGLLAGGLDNGAVCVWDPAEFSYEPGIPAISEKLPRYHGDGDKTYTLGVCTGGLFWDPSTICYASNQGVTANEIPKSKFKKMEETVTKMSIDLIYLIMEQFGKEVPDEALMSKKLPKSADQEKSITVSDEWVLVQGDSDSEEEEDLEIPSSDQYKNVHHDDWLFSHKGKGFLLKLPDLTGPVLGLDFNHEYGNMLAAAAYGDKLNIYYIDCPVTDSSAKAYELSDGSESVKNAQVTFLNWHPTYPVILASTCDSGTALIWDIRTKKPISRVKHGQTGYCEVHWQPNKLTSLAIASNGNYSSDPVKIWDFTRPGMPTHTFGPKKGVRTMSWSAADHNLIITTDMDGKLNCWKLNGERSADGFTLHTADNLEARWCQSGDVVAVSSSTNIALSK